MAQNASNSCSSSGSSRQDRVALVCHLLTHPILQLQKQWFALSRLGYENLDTYHDYTTMYKRSLLDTDCDLLRLVGTRIVIFHIPNSRLAVIHIATDPLKKPNSIQTQCSPKNCQLRVLMVNACGIFIQQLRKPLLTRYSEGNSAEGTKNQ